MRLAHTVPPLLLPLFLLACAGAAPGRPMTAESQAGLDTALAGLVAGPATSCIPIGYRTTTTQAFGPTLLYKLPNGEVYRNDTGGGCENAGHGDILVQIEHQGRPCAGDIIRTVEPLGRLPSGSCSLAQFVPYTKPRR